MNSTSLPAAFSRLLDRLRSAFVPTLPTKRDAPSGALPFAAPAVLATVPAPLPVSTPMAAPVPAHQEERDAPDSVPPLRTLEEVRADLAKLREVTRARHAEAQTRRELSFAPTDFMDFADQPSGAVQDGPSSNFAPTDFLDFGSIDLQPAR